MGMSDSAPDGPLSPTQGARELGRQGVLSFKSLELLSHFYIDLYYNFLI